MRVGLIDVDGHRYPNVALMKLSAWHKAKGDTVGWWSPETHKYEVVYKSKIFSSTYSKDTPDPKNADQVIRGGTGYAIDLQNGLEVYDHALDPRLPDYIENMFPDYGLYPELTENTAYGFLTRGCPRGCPFCIVGEKEGRCSRRVAELSQFWSGQKEIKLMDPNILACRDRDTLLQELVSSKAYVDFNQGLDIRFADAEVAELLGRMRIKRLHFAWDNPKEDLTEHFKRFTERYRRKDHRTKIVYVLTNFGSTLVEDLYRIYTLRSLGYDPDVRIYNKPSAPQVLRDLQRWCNNRIIFKSCTDFKDYVPTRQLKEEPNNAT